MAVGLCVAAIRRRVWGERRRGRGRDRGMPRRLGDDGLTEDGAGGAAGQIALARRFVEGAAVLGQDGEGEMPGLGGGVGGTADGEFVGGGQESSDGLLRGPGEELGEFEVVGLGDLHQGGVGVEEL